MADNITPEAVVTPGDFDFATDECTINTVTVQVPRTKLGFGVDGTYDGDVDETNPLPVQLRDSGGTELGTSAAPVRVDPTGTTAQPVTGTFWQATQPVSAASLPLPSGAATESTLNSIGALLVSGIPVTALPAGLATGAKQDAGNTSLASIDSKLSALTACDTGAVVIAGGSVAVTGTFWQATQPISATALPLPTGAATEATLAALSAKITACNTGAVVLAGGTAAIGKLEANSGVVIGAVEIAAAQTVAATQSGTWNVGTVTTVTTVTTVATVTSLAQWAGNAIDTNSGNKSAGTLRVVLATDQPALTTPMPQNQTQVGGTAIDVNSGNKSNGTQRVILATDQPALSTPLPVAVNAQTTGGATPAQVLSAASNNATSIKASAGTLYSLVVINTTATIYYLKFYDKASAPSPASDTPLQTIPIPANTAGAGVAVPIPSCGIAFPTGIALAIVGGIAANDNTNAATGVAVSLSYK